jgi:hypothetical protein
MISKKQDSLYWREWAAAKKFCASLDLPEPDRHQLHTQALGADKSHKDFTNADLDKVLAAFRAISDPANVQAQLRQIDQPRTRLLYAINRLSAQLSVQLAGPDSQPSTLNPQLGGYASAISLDKFGTSDLTTLAEPQLEQLRNTLASRLTVKKTRAKKPPAEMVTTEPHPF